MAISTRFLVPSLFMRLARWVLTVLRLMWSSLAISAFVRPRATVTRTSSSRAVRGSIGWGSGSLGGKAPNAASRRTVTLGAIKASPLAAAWTAWVSSSGPASLRRNPRAPALSAPWTYSARSNVAMTTTGGGSAAAAETSAGPRLEGAVDVLVEVERRDDHHGERILDGRPSQRTCRLEPVELGHADVEQADIGSQLAGEGDGFPAVPRLADHVDVGLGVEDHAQPGPDDLLVVGDEDADVHRLGPARGSTASTTQPWSGLGPAARVPPRSAARSVIPTTPDSWATLGV